MNKKTIGIIGCGAIGSALAKYADENLRGNINQIILCDADTQKAKALAQTITASCTSADIDEIIERADLVIEAVSPKIVPEIADKCVGKAKDIMVMSIGGLLGHEQVFDKARDKGVRMLLPSGAIAGIDALKASRISGIESVTITTRKPPKSVKGAPYLAENNINVDEIQGEKIIFEGNALQAIKGFPKNVNVSALLSIAGIGPEKTKVRIMISPEYTRNSHEVQIKSNAGTVTTRTENVPSPQNPKTSYLAALSAISTLKKTLSPVQVGT